MKNKEWVFIIVSIMFLIIYTFATDKHKEKEAVPFIIKGDVEYVYEGDTAVHHYEFEDKYDPRRSVSDIDVEYAAPAGYINSLVLSVKMKPSGYNNPTRYDMELFYIPDRRFAVKNITWEFTQKRKLKK